MAGSRNITTLTLDQKLPQQLRRIQSEALQFNNAQPIGVDSLAVVVSSVSVVGPVTVSAGNIHSFIFNVTSDVTERTLWNFPFSVFIDTYTDPQKLPDGSVVSAIAQKFPFGGHHDQQDSNPSTNTQYFKIWVINNDSVDHLCYVTFQAVRPRGA